MVHEINPPFSFFHNENASYSKMFNPLLNPKKNKKEPVHIVNGKPYDPLVKHRGSQVLFIHDDGSEFSDLESMGTSVASERIYENYFGDFAAFGDNASKKKRCRFLPVIFLCLMLAALSGFSVWYFRGNETSGGGNTITDGQDSTSNQVVTIGDDSENEETSCCCVATSVSVSVVVLAVVLGVLGSYWGDHPCWSDPACWCSGAKAVQGTVLQPPVESELPLPVESELPLPVESELPLPGPPTPGPHGKDVGIMFAKWPGDDSDKFSTDFFKIDSNKVTRLHGVDEGMFQARYSFDYDATFPYNSSTLRGLVDKIEEEQFKNKNFRVVEEVYLKLLPKNGEAGDEGEFRVFRSRQIFYSSKFLLFARDSTGALLYGGGGFRDIELKEIMSMFFKSWPGRTMYFQVVFK